ncbi:MAG: threonine ammonia-lyase [Mogibacterium sp.]|nr:threonine ammonia-lyase [Mogibacterium sp.]MBR2539411.1 threonine ammonia-lyase [Mogibacterium sp.]
MNNQLSLDRIYQAAFALKDVARKTDLIYSPHFSGKNQVFFKTENLQVTGSFKLRGAYFKISRLTDEEKAAGIVACSAGNHAQGVALSAQRMGIKATICMPDGAPISKVQATKSYGAEVALVKGAYDDAYQYACKLQEEAHATFIHPFDDPDVIAGQGTIGLEILDQLSDVDAIVVPIGGGGLISGVAFAAKSLKPDIKIYGVQAKEAASMADSLKYDEQVTLKTVNTFADGIAVKHPGDLTFELIKDYVDEVVTVTEDEIAVAILALIEKQKLIAEGAGAVSLAAVMADKIPVEGKNVVCIVSGGNIDVNILSRVITRGLVTSGRNATLQIALEDKPGQLVDVATIIASCGANVTGVHYGHSDPNTAVTSCVLTLEIETRDFEQLEQIRQTLTDQGFNLVQ